jgi:hypothetical protein
LPDDLNTIGWSLSMARIERDLFMALLDAALVVGEKVQMWPKEVDWRIEDSWSLVRTRSRLRSFRDVVLHRHRFTCAMCGTRRRSVLEVAHIRRYAADRNQRANPANGICLCRFCHAAFDAGDVILYGNGRIVVLAEMDDDVSQSHFAGVPASVREGWLSGVDLRFLEERAAACVPIQRQ